MNAEYKIQNTKYKVNEKLRVPGKFYKSYKSYISYKSYSGGGAKKKRPGRGAFLWRGWMGYFTRIFLPLVMTMPRALPLMRRPWRS